MNKLIICFAFLFCMFNVDLLLAATDLTGKTFVMTGKFLGVATASCKKAGNRNIPIRPQKRLHANIAFNQGNVFLWSESGLSIGPLINVPGVWFQKGTFIDLEFDDASSSGLKATAQILPQTFSQQGVTVAINNTKYGFSAKTNSTGNQLTVTETGSFKIIANGTFRGVSDSCVARVKLQRIYKGRSG